MKEKMTGNVCKICGSSALTVFAHTAKCGACGVLLYYPYPVEPEAAPPSEEGKQAIRERVLDWHARASFYNHDNFTRIVRFAMGEADKRKPLTVLDYGGGGGQFAMVCKSLFPACVVSYTDLSDSSLLREWSACNNRIPFREFAGDGGRFDFIFLNDVLEHVREPVPTLRMLAEKLSPGGTLFVDTPRQFWLYPVARRLAKPLYRKLLRGTVSAAHLQIWTRPSFETALRDSGLAIHRYEEVSEYTMPADFYLRNMGISNPLLRLAGRVFYAQAGWLAKNKILAICRMRPLGVGGRRSEDGGRRTEGGGRRSEDGG